MSLSLVEPKLHIPYRHPQAVFANYCTVKKRSPVPCMWAEASVQVAQRIVPTVIIIIIIDPLHSAAVIAAEFFVVEA